MSQIENCTVLLVATNAELVRRVTSALSEAGHEIILARSYAAAKARCGESPLPHIIITELKLGEYNGLHLVVRGQSLGIPAIVIGDPSFQRDAEQLGAVWLPTNVDAERLQGLVAKLKASRDHSVL